MHDRPDDPPTGRPEVLDPGYLSCVTVWRPFHSNGC